MTKRSDDAAGSGRLRQRASSPPVSLDRQANSGPYTVVRPDDPSARGFRPLFARWRVELERKFRWPIERPELAPCGSVAAGRCAAPPRAIVARARTQTTAVFLCQFPLRSSICTCRRRRATTQSIVLRPSRGRYGRAKPSPRALAHAGPLMFGPTSSMWSKKSPPSPKNTPCASVAADARRSSSAKQIVNLSLCGRSPASYRARTPVPRLVRFDITAACSRPFLSVVHQLTPAPARPTPSFGTVFAADLHRQSGACAKVGQAAVARATEHLRWPAFDGRTLRSLPRARQRKSCRLSLPGCGRGGAVVLIDRRSRVRSVWGLLTLPRLRRHGAAVIIGGGGGGLRQRGRLGDVARPTSSEDFRKSSDANVYNPVVCSPRRGTP